MRCIVARARIAGKRANGRREEILRGAGAVLRESKGGALRMERVAERIGLVKGNIYYYFKDRQDLLYHCHLRCIELSLQALDEALASKGSAARRLRRLLERHIEIILNSDFGGALLADMDEMRPARRRRYVALRDRFERGIRQLITAGQDAGEFRDQDVRLAGFAILGAINWMPKWYRADGRLSAHAVAEAFASFHLKALER
jgi:AcrR family transcriptional regulator